MAKQVTDRGKVMQALESAADTHGPDIAQAVEKALAPHLEKGEKMPDVGRLIALLGRHVRAAQEGLAAASQAHELELGDDAGPRAARERTAAAVRTTLVDLRAAADATFGEAGSRALGFDGVVPQDPVALAELGARVLVALRKEKLELPPARRGLRLDRGSFAEELGATLPALKTALADVAREAREAEQTLAAKWAAMERVDRARVNGGAVLSSLAALGGLDEVAARVRPSARRASGDEGEETPPESPPPA